MLISTLVLCLVWVISLIHAQKHHKDKYKWEDTVISKYIKHDKFLQFGFVALGVQLALAGVHFKEIQYVLPLFVASGIGAIFVMLTETIISNKRLHILSAGACYGFALIACILASSNPILLGIAIGNVIYVIFGHFLRDEVGDKERYTALGLITWFQAAIYLI